MDDACVRSFNKNQQTNFSFGFGFFLNIIDLDMCDFEICDIGMKTGL